MYGAGLLNVGVWAWCPLDAGEAFDKDSSRPAGPSWILKRGGAVSHAGREMKLARWCLWVTGAVPGVFATLNRV